MKLRWVIIAFALVFLAILFWPKKKNDYSDLAIYRQPIAAESNAFYSLKKIPGPKLELRYDFLEANWTLDTVKHLEELLSHFQTFDAALSNSSMQIPSDLSAIDVTGFLNKCEAFSSANLLRAKSEFIQGEEPKAVSILIQNLHFAKMIETSGAGFFGSGSAYEITYYSLELARMFAVRGYDKQSLENLANRLYPPTPNFSELGKETFFWWSKILYDLSLWPHSHETPMPALMVNPISRGAMFDPLETEELLAERARHIIQNSNRGFTNIPSQPWPEPSYLQIFSGNVLGRIIAKEIVPDTKMLLISRLHEAARFECTRVLLLLRCFYLDHGTYPERLEELPQPTPVDPFDGQPLRYSKEKQIVYSVGRDLIDDGGDQARGSGVFVRPRGIGPPTFPVARAGVMANSFPPFEMNYKISRRAASLSPSLTLAIDSKAKAMKAEGLDVVGFGAGEPDFDTPQHIKDACTKAIADGFTKYTPSSGIPELRQAIADKFKRDNGLNYKPSQVIVSSGGKHSCYNVILATCEEGDEVVIPSPYWLSYPEMVKLAGATSVILETSDKTEFKVTPEMLRNAITPKTRLFILNSPSNPTGSLYSREEIKALGDICVEKGVLIMSDEIYEKLVYDGAQHTSVAAFSQAHYDHTIVVHGLAKAYSMTGWRLGYLAAPEPIAKAIDAIQSHSTSNPTSFAQKGGVAALNGPQDHLSKWLEEYAKRRSFAHQKLNSIPGISCVNAKGAFYLFPNISKLGLKSADFCARLLEKEKVAAVPGIAFGADDYIRISYATSMANIEKGLNRIEKFVKEL